MEYFPKYHRRSIRLANWDYSDIGMYFVTICMKNMECWFGEIKNHEMFLSRNGEIARNCYLEIPKHFLNVDLDVFQIMPNHIHGIIVIYKKYDRRRGVACNAPTRMSKISPKFGTLSTIVRSYKSAVTKKCHELLVQANGNTESFLWQRNYYEHIIRDERELFIVRNYIKNNPLEWPKDRNNIFS